MANETDRDEATVDAYTSPAGGWGSLASVGHIVEQEGVPLSATLLMSRQNKPGGFACVSCAWAKPAHAHAAEFCENGAKATAWEITAARTTPEFFAEHTVTELRTWSDHALEAHGRLTHPMRYDPATDTYKQISWRDAFTEIGHELRALDPARETVLYTSGRASLESSYMWALFARLYGTNNLPDSSNMCHESTSIALPESIGVPVGTVRLRDFEHTDCILFFGQNPGTSSPRMLRDLRNAAKRDVPIITFNPLRERGLEVFVDPQSPAEMLTGRATPISTQYHQLRIGGDIAAIMGMCKALIETDRLDHAFIAQHTHGFDAFAATARAYDWAELEQKSGLDRAAMQAAARVYAGAETAMALYGMGVTQHRAGVETCQMVANLLLLRGNIGKPGAGILPVRGHSNVQGQRTVGISEKPDLVPLDTLAEQFGFEPPRTLGMNTVEACEGVLSGQVRAFIALGGNFIRAVPETAAMESAWSGLRLSVQISTKLNRAHLIHGEISYILPCLGRIEVDMQASGPQSVTIEDSTACIHESRGLRPPASPELLSEPAIIAGLAQATLRPNPLVPWTDWVADYGRVRDAIAVTYPEIFHDFNARMSTPGGFERPLKAEHREWATSTGRANFIIPRSLDADADAPAAGDDVLQLMTLRSNDQFNTTVYGFHDRFRGVRGTRMVLFMNQADMDRLGFVADATVNLTTAVDDGITRRVEGFRVLPYNIPAGCVGGYFPECNPLLPLWHHAERSKVPAAKSIPVRITRP